MIMVSFVVCRAMFVIFNAEEEYWIINYKDKRGV